MRAPLTPLAARDPRRTRAHSWLATAALVLGCGAGVPQQLPQGQLSANEAETYSRRHLQDARALQDEGRLESAARVAARGLDLQPDNADLQRLRAEVLDELGRKEAAKAHRRVADLLEPPPPPPPSTPVEWSHAGLRVIVLPPPREDADAHRRIPVAWPSGPVAQRLRERLTTRLPDAEVVFAEEPGPATVAEGRAALEASGARRALSLRIDRSYCGRTLKDGAFAVAWIRAAGPVGRPSESSPPPRIFRHSVSAPDDPALCREEVLSIALERLLADDAILAAMSESPGLAAAEASPVWTNRDIRHLHPSLGLKLAAEIDAGRELLSRGRLGASLDHFRRAAAIDPEDIDAQAFVEDAEMAMALSIELSPVSLNEPSGPVLSADAADPGVLAPSMSASDMRVLETLLEDERRQRDDLLAALAVLDEDRFAPSPKTLESLRRAELSDPDAIGARLARDGGVAGDELETRLLYAPDGAVLARYYFRRGESLPRVREEDADNDGRPDRWIVYSKQARRRVYEDRRGGGSPDLVLVFAQGGAPLERLEIDQNSDGTPERVFRYEEGRLIAEDRDTNGDGRADVFERFDPDGSLALRERDVNGDGNVDVRSAYRQGRIVRREIVNPDAVTEIQ